MNNTDQNAIEKLREQIRFANACYCDPAVREQRTADAIADADAALAAGQWIIEDGSGVSLFDPAYAMRGFVPRRWMTQQGIAMMRTLDKAVKVGDNFVREVGFHPRHGIKTRSYRRLA